MKYQFTGAEWSLIHDIAVHQFNQVRAAGTPQGHGEPGDNFENRRFPGAAAEFTIRKLFNLPQVYDVSWSPYDLGDKQIRGTNHSGGHFIAYESDPNDALGILVTIDIPGQSATIAGAKLISECKQEMFRPTPYINSLRRESAQILNDYWVPQQCLRPLQYLIECEPKFLYAD